MRPAIPSRSAARNAGQVGLERVEAGNEMLSQVAAGVIDVEVEPLARLTQSSRETRSLN